MSKFKKAIATGLALSFVMTLGAQAAKDTPPGDPTDIPKSLEIDWQERYSFAELESQMFALADEYPKLVEQYSIGHSWQERDIWCLEITDESVNDEGKTGIGIFANIHGGERESATSAMYTAWWMLLNSEDDYIEDLLEDYIIYVIPVINPDGYEQSFVYNTRQNLRPSDANGDGIPFGDPYTDINGDNYIATLYRGMGTETPTTKDLVRFGMESSDWDKNGVLGDDPRTSPIDLNRTFDYQWNRFDIDTVGSITGVIGANSFLRSGPYAASEPEVQAVQNFLYRTDMHALATIHTGIQCVLYPWGFRPADENNPLDSDIAFMKETSDAMAATLQETTGRGFYSMQSYTDYPTAGELIDFAYGRLGIHSYTVEIYRGGSTGNIEDYRWENTLPEPTWVFYTQDQLKTLGLDPATLTDASGMPLAEGEGLWFYTSSVAQMVDKAPEDQLTMAQGTRDSLLVMIESEPNGDGSSVPEYIKWEMGIE